MKHKIMLGIISTLRGKCQSHIHRTLYSSTRQISTTSPLKDNIQPMAESYRVSLDLEKLLRKKDNIPDNYRIIYRHCEIFNYTAARALSNIVLVGITAVGIYLCIFGYNPEPTVVFDVNYNPGKTAFFIMYAFVWVALSIIRYLTRKCALRIYYNASNSSYKIISLSDIPFRNICTDFTHHKKSLVERSSLVNRFCADAAKIVVNNNKFIVFQDEFRTPADFYNFVDGEIHDYDR